MQSRQKFNITKEGFFTLAIIFFILLTLGGYVIYTYFTANDVKSETELLFESNENFEPYADLLGNEVFLTDYLGMVVVVHSWASWCPSCVEQIKMFQNSTVNNTNDVKIIAINRAESINTIERFKNAFGIDDEVLMVLDPSDRFYNSVDAYAMPETIIYDKEGNRALHVNGEISQSELEVTIATLLAQD